MINKELYGKALKTYGLEKQLIVAIKKMAELQKELTKILIGQGDIDRLAEGVADVEIMLEQVRYFYGLGLSVETVKKLKLERLEKRLQNEKK